MDPTMDTFLSDARQTLDTIKTYLDMPNINKSQIEKLTIFAGIISEMENILQSEGESKLGKMRQHLQDIQSQVQELGGELSMG